VTSPETRSKPDAEAALANGEAKTPEESNDKLINVRVIKKAVARCMLGR
jgi:hypothetical protein